MHIRGVGARVVFLWVSVCKIAPKYLLHDGESCAYFLQGVYVLSVQSVLLRVF